MPHLSAIDIAAINLLISMVLNIHDGHYGRLSVTCAVDVATALNILVKRTSLPMHLLNVKILS